MHMMLLIGVVAVVVGLLAIYCGHELGHWFPARVFGMRTPVLSIGIGPRKYARILFRCWQTEFRLSPIPVGGFVQLPDLHGDTAFVAGAAREVSKRFPIWQRLIVVFSGVAMNFLIAIILLFAVFAAKNISNPSAHVSWSVAALKSTQFTFDLTRQTFHMMGATLHLVPAAQGEDASNVHSVVAVAAYGASVFTYSVANFVILLAIISINFGVFNILPIPVLDGGTAMYLAIEAVRGKPIPTKIRVRIGKIFFYALIGLVVLSFVNDFRHPLHF
jgi:membrane-associated protease RseP (regulator of RpoE activity)